MFRNSALIFMINFLFSIQQLAYCQENLQGANEQEALKNAVSGYTRSLGEQSGIYRGSGYIGYPYEIKDGHPFFESYEVTKGSVYYDGMLYQDIPLWYDLLKNQVVIQYIDNFSKISLHNEKIEYFSLFNHVFVNITKDTSNTLLSGFYDRVYQKETEVLVKRSKSSVQHVTPEGIFLMMLKQKDQIYLKKEGRYYFVDSPGTVLKALGSNQKEIQAYLKKNKIRFRKNPEKATVMMVSFYDKLKD